ncbi:MAG: helix-turn-helix domain-containing protein [Caulobacteraceae bacterium]
MAHTRFDSDPALRSEVRKRALRAKAWEALVTTFKARQADGMTQAELARILGKKAEQVSRVFSRPQNYTIDTISEYLSGLDARVDLTVEDLRSRQSTNCDHPYLKMVLTRMDSLPPSMPVPKAITSDVSNAGKSARVALV